MADLDFFKLYNDTYGHQAGDDCLRAVASILRKAAGRISDIAARYGGEEFVVLLPNTDRNGALKVAEAIRESLAAEALPHETSTVKDTVTLTMGVATVTPNRSITPKMLIKFADQALYVGKANGKDRIQFFT
jgi:diguanylate cyclase (GGDEF)-like protein